MLVGDVSDVHQEHAQEVLHLRLALAAQRQTGSPECRLVGQRQLSGLRRAASEERFQNGCLAQEQRAQLTPCCGSSRIHPLDALAIGAMQHHGMAIRREHDGRAELLRRKFQPVLFQLERADHVRMQPVEDVCHRRDAKTGRELLRACRAAHLIGGLQQKHLAAALRQRGRGDEAVVPAADDDRIPFRFR